MQQDILANSYFLNLGYSAVDVKMHLQKQVIYIIALICNTLQNTIESNWSDLNYC